VEFALSKIAQIEITVSNLARSVEFYRDALGLTLTFEAPHAAFFDCAGVRLVLSLLETVPDIEPRWHRAPLYFEAADIQAATRILEARGVCFERTPYLVAKMPRHDLWMAFFHDPDQNVLALMSEQPR
jgi:methylmalonyl-CoA/ethylmalonyl-CoA epimerase